ncbi:hypothetical protein M405DRAFT_806119 [Rhizopogon salebrosus TDB-379]|nr:hypothetical protein M405DRAFT_806119 [Rhizopogon salebrosus TDB-379]
MSDAEDGLAVLCGCCCVALAGALQTWCNTNAFGADARCCGGSQGCCGSCFQGSLDEDNFDEQLKKQREREKDTSGPVETQPGPSDNMTADMKEGPREALNNASASAQQS